MNTNEQDINWWKAALNGDNDAYRLLFLNHYPWLFQYGKRMTGNPDMVEDAIQELFADIWQQQTAPPNTSVRAYLVRALKYKLIRQLEKSRRTVLKEEDTGFELSHEVFVIAQQEHHALGEKMKAALAQLSPRQKEIIYLKYYQELRYEEICEIMQLNYQGSRNLLYQALKSLRKLLEPEALRALLFM
ncbi:MAG: RNA polymerase sigma factor [Chitinophagaceae bacterium]